MKIANRIAYGPSGKPKAAISSVTYPKNVPKTIPIVSQSYNTERTVTNLPEKVDLQDTVHQLRSELADSQFELKMTGNQLHESQKALDNCQINAKSDLEALQKVISSQSQDLQLSSKENNQLKSQIETLRSDLLRTDEALQKALASKQSKNDVNFGEMAIIGNTSIRKSRKGTISVRSGSSHTTYTPKSSQYYIRGPRGGCFYYTSSGRKEYVDRSLCN